MRRPGMLVLLAVAGIAQAQGVAPPAPHAHAHAETQASEAPPFQAASSRSFAVLMDDAMRVMDVGMRQAPMTGDASHDFVTMMIPHHQGAVDMAKAVLLYSDDPELRNLAQSIVVEQATEISLMRAWLQRHPDSTPPESHVPRNPP